MKPVEEVERLKQNWLNDPIYDIEDAIGFEDYYDELVKFRIRWEEHWKQERIKKQQAEDLQWSKEAEQYQCSVQTLKLIKELQARIDKLENELRGDW